MGGRAWTDEDLAFLRQHYPLENPRALARHLERTPEAVLTAIRKHGLCDSERNVLLPTRVWEHWDRGLCDREIARALGCHHTTVQHHRQDLGLPPNVDRQGRESRIRARQRLLREENFESLAQLQAHRQRIACLLRGWAGAQSSRQCDVLDALQDGGPQTLAQIRDALDGYCWVLKILRKLRALKLVSSSYRYDGCECRSYLYSLRRGVKRQYRAMPNQENAEC